MSGMQKLPFCIFKLSSNYSYFLSLAVNLTRRIIIFFIILLSRVTGFLFLPEGLDLEHYQNRLCNSDILKGFQQHPASDWGKVDDIGSLPDTQIVSTRIRIARSLKGL